MTDLSFKPATPDDTEALIAMMRECYAHDGLAFDEAIARRALLGVIGDDTLGRIFLILLANEVAGYAVLTFGYSLEFHGRDAFVDELYLRAEYRGQGIGKRALRFLTEVCAREGVNALHLEVERENASAQAVYRKFGFEDHDRYLMTKMIFNNDSDEWMGGAGLRKLCLNRPPEPALPSNPSPDVAKDSTA